MKHAIDNVTGVVVFIPENEQDRKALFHLMGYLEAEQHVYRQPEITGTALIGFNRR